MVCPLHLKEMYQIKFPVLSNMVSGANSYAIHKMRAPQHRSGVLCARRQHELFNTLRRLQKLNHVQVHGGKINADDMRPQADPSKRYNVILGLVVRFLALPDKNQLHNFLAAKPEAISIPFISWIADQESIAVGEHRQVLSGICQELINFREQYESDGMEALYADTLTALTEEEVNPGAAALVLAARPEQYAAKLAHLVTGSPVLKDGFDPVYNLLLNVAPPAALTTEGVAKAHESAKNLAVDLRTRRQRSVQSMIGRVQLTPEQADKLLTGTNAARILDMLLSLPSNADRVSVLPDCFQPAASDGDEESKAGVKSSDLNTAPPPSSDSDLVWCTPSQLLVEVETRLLQLERPQPSPSSPMSSLGHGGSEDSLSGSFLEELRYLRTEVRRTWLETLEVNK